jgi:hypothetical protein
MASRVPPVTVGVASALAEEPLRRRYKKATHRQGRCPGEASPGTLPPGGNLQAEVCVKTTTRQRGAGTAGSGGVRATTGLGD